MTTKSTVRDMIRAEVVRTAAVLYGAKNYERWHTTKVYPEQIQAVWKMAYNELANRHPKREWLKLLTEQSSKNIELKLVLRVPDKQVEIDLPSTDTKFSAIAHAGGKEMLLELFDIIQEIAKKKID